MKKFFELIPAKFVWAVTMIPLLALGLVTLAAADRYTYGSDPGTINISMSDRAAAILLITGIMPATMMALFFAVGKQMARVPLAIGVPILAVCTLYSRPINDITKLDRPCATLGAIGGVCLVVALAIAAISLPIKVTVTSAVPDDASSLERVAAGKLRGDIM